METVFERQKANIKYYSLTAVDPDTNLQTRLTLLKKNLDAGLMTEDEVDAKKAELHAAPEDVETVDVTHDQLKAISERYNLLSPIATATRAAQIAMTVAMLNEKVSDVESHIKAVKDSSGESWRTLRTWCDEPAQWAKVTGEDGKEKTVLQKKTGEARVPADVVRAINAKAKELKKS